MRARRLAIPVLGLALLTAAGWGVWTVYTAARGEASDPDESVVAMAEAEVRTLEEIVVTQGLVGFEHAGDVVASSAGRVTHIEVQPGEQLAAGNVLMRIDGRAVVAVSGTVPFWRDLVRGDRGDDVQALQELLDEAGLLSIDPDGRFGPATEDALKGWQDSYGATEPDGVLLLSDLVVGDWPARVGTVSVDVGAFVSGGEVAMSLTTGAPVVTLDLLPSDRLRVDTGTPVRATVAATGDQSAGEITAVAVDPVDRDGSLYYPATVTLDDDLVIPEGTQVRVTLVIEQAPDVLAIPIVAVISDADGQPIVRVETSTGDVETQAVELGLSQGAWVEVTSGLQRGDRVVVSEAPSDDG